MGCGDRTWRLTVKVTSIHSVSVEAPTAEDAEERYHFEGMSPDEWVEGYVDETEVVKTEEVRDGDGI